MEERSKQGFCYNCDEKWQLGHKCKGAKFFLLEGSSLSIERNQGMQLVELDDQGAVVGSTYHEVMEDSCNAEITLYAMVGSPSSNTMRVQSKIKNQEIVSLLDTGSTHNFLMPLGYQV